MASGSHTCSGNCADLPIAPQNISRPANCGARAQRGGFAAMAVCKTPKLSEPSSLQTIKMPARKPKSPKRFVMNAFLAASAALGFSNQKPMSR